MSLVCKETYSASLFRCICNISPVHHVLIHVEAPLISSDFPGANYSPDLSTDGDDLLDLEELKSPPEHDYVNAEYNSDSNDLLSIGDQISGAGYEFLILILQGK